MDDSHLRENIRHDESDTSPQKVGNDHGGASETDCDAASQEQADTDGAAYCHHGELPLAEATVKATFACRHGILLAQCSTNR
jgi:hypothetical protein